MPLVLTPFEYSRRFLAPTAVALLLCAIASNAIGENSRALSEASTEGVSKPNPPVGTPVAATRQWLVLIAINDYCDSANQKNFLSDLRTCRADAAACKSLMIQTFWIQVGKYH